MMCMYVVSRQIKRADIVDVAWGLGFIIASITTLYYSKTFTTENLVLNGLIVIWGGRLALHIYNRNKGKKQDKRYTALISKWKNNQWAIFAKVFMFQGFLVFLVSLPIVINNSYKSDMWSTYNSMGLVIWIIGYFFESMADAQLRNFKAKPANKGRIMTQGLWKYSRHPNYFGEVTMWWGIFVYTLGTPLFALKIISPVVITLLILKVSGIPMAEEHYEGDPKYERYKKMTSVFFPLPRKKL